MRGSATILGLVLLMWVAGSAWWYTCKIKENCISFSKNTTRQSQQLIIDLEGEDVQTFYLKNAGNGILQVIPGEEGNAIGIIRTYLDKHPYQEIDLVAQNEDHANGLLAMLIISGVPNRRVNVFTDESLGSKDRPMSIRSSFKEEEITAEDFKAAEPDSMIIMAENVVKQKVEPEENKSKENKPEEIKTVTKPVVKPYVPYSMPCPVVETSTSLPTIETLYYPSAAYKVRCTSRLLTFADAAASYISENAGQNLVITGFTDGDKEKVNNYQLALKRAVEVKKYLIKRGIPGHRIETYSRGADSPIADNDTEEGKKLNRRVTIKWN